MGRFLILLGLVALAAWLIKRIYLNSPKQETTSGQEHALMKKCAHCDLHLPESQGIKDSEGHFFCSTEHLNQHKDQA